MFTDSPDQVWDLPEVQGPQWRPVNLWVCVRVVNKGGTSLREPSRTCWSILCNYQPIETWFISQGIISISRQSVCVCVGGGRSVYHSRPPLSPLQLHLHPFVFLLSVHHFILVLYPSILPQPNLNFRLPPPSWLLPSEAIILRPCQYDQSTKKKTNWPIEVFYS